MTDDDLADAVEPDWLALGKEVRRRRALLHLRQADLEARGGPGAGTVRNIEQASRTSYAQRTFVQLDTALQWPDGTAQSILDGDTAPEAIRAVTDNQLRTPAVISSVMDTVEDEHARRVGRLVLALIRELQEEL